MCGTEGQSQTKVYATYNYAGDSYDWPSRLIKPERPASNNAGILTLRIANVVFASYLAEPAYAVGGASAGCFLP